MSNPWLRLWRDMPNDPKWRTIAKISGQSVSVVQAIFLQLLVSASDCGKVKIDFESIASALDESVDSVKAVLQAMEHRVLDGDVLSGWVKRQPIREDDSANRAKKWRERKRTKENAPEERREEEKREEEKKIKNLTAIPEFVDAELFQAFDEMRKKIKKPMTERAARGIINKLTKFHEDGYDANAILDASIINCWQDVFANDKTPKRKQRYVVDTRPFEEQWPEFAKGKK